MMNYLKNLIVQNIGYNTSHRQHKYSVLLVVLVVLVSFLSVPGRLVNDTDVVLAATDPVIAAAGDIACDPTSSNFNDGNGTSTRCRQKYTSDLLLDPGLAGVLMLGDGQYECGSLQAHMQSYDLSWGRVKSITYPVVGNHEYQTTGGADCTTANAGAAGYFDYFGAAAGTPGQGYYSFDIGEWHIIVLNSNCAEVGGCDASSPQGQWLQADLASHTNMCTLASFHHPLFSSGTHASTSSLPFWQLLYQYNAELILAGHDHLYERFAPQNPSGAADPVNGIRQFIVGTGGEEFHTISQVALNSEARNDNTFGVLKLTLHPTSYDWEFVPEAGGTYTDSGTSPCHDPVPATPTSLPSSNPLYASFGSNGNVGGVSFADEDIVKFDGSAWSLFFDGSDVGVGGSDLFGFSIVDSDTLLMSFSTALTLNGISVTPQDVVQFDAASLGINTAGIFSMHLNGIDVGLDATAESIDSVSLLPDGRILLSTTGSSTVPGVAGQDEDVLAFTPTSLGNVTSGTWTMYFDGSDVGLADTSNEDVDALDVDPNGNIYLSTVGDFGVGGVSGFDEDVFVCSPTSIGSVTACNYSSSLYFDGSVWGQDANDLDAFNLLISGPFPTATPSNTPTPTNTSTPTSTATITMTPTSLPSTTPLYVSFESNGSIGSVAFADEDIMKYNGSVWSQYFDGSDVGVGGSDLFGFSVVDSDTLLMSFTTALTLNGISVTPQDVVQFDATSLGSVTAGTFSMYLNGIDVGLDVAAESIDSVSLLADGRVLISTSGSSTVPGLAGQDEDVLAFTSTSLGNVTSGTWAMYFDGGDVGLADASTEDVDALDVDPNGNIYLSTLGDFAVSGVSGFDEDIFVCSPTSIGSVTACNYSQALYFDGSLWGLDTNDVDAFNLLISGPFPTATPSNTPVPTNTPAPTNTPTATFTATSTPTTTATSTIGPSPTFTNTPTSTSTPLPTNTPTITLTPTDTPTFTPTSLATTLPDLIFADGFESGSLSAWSSTSTGAGDLSVTASAALIGSNGMQAIINDTTNMYTIDDTPNAELRYRARFYFDPNSISMVDGNAHYILVGYDVSTAAVFNMDFRIFGGSYQIRLRQQNDSLATTSTAWVTISDAPHFIEMDWWSATAVSANNGGVTLWIDGVQAVSLSGLDNDTRRIEQVRFGAVSGIDAGTLGTYYLDAFESRRQSYIGP